LRTMRTIPCSLSVRQPLPLPFASLITGVGENASGVPLDEIERLGATVLITTAVHPTSAWALRSHG